MGFRLHGDASRKPSSRSLLVDEQSDTWPLLRGNDRKSRHRRIKKQRRSRRASGGVCPVPLLLDSILSLSHGKAHCHLVSELQAPRIRAPLAADCSLLCILTPAWYKRSEEVKR